jgi:beta-mannosidase
MDLNGTWRLMDFDPGDGVRQRAFASDLDDTAWLTARVPGNVHTALVEAGRIEPPFFDMNADACRWVELREWWYRRSFEYQQGRSGDCEWLVFDGLDTLSTIYLNGSELGRHENMFVPARFDVTGKLRPGRNGVALRFDPIVAHVGNRNIPGNWTWRAPERVWVRKAQYNFGWDWAPRLVTMGPWQGVHLDTCPQTRVAAVFFHTHLISAQRDRAEVAVEVQIDGVARLQRERPAGVQDAQIKVTLTRGQARQQAITGIAPDGRARAALAVPDPDLWWTHDLGVPALYDLEVTLVCDDQLLDSCRERVGIRTISWDQSPDRDEPGAFFFTPVLNGVSIFAKGANWVPPDSFLSEVDESQYRDLLELAAEARMNMLRVWGGGIYEKHDFYRLCDELGILVWQDFMYACALYPDFELGFLEEAEREARGAIMRLRNHPCIALWCGNNENDWTADQTFWSQPGCDFAGKRICHELLPRVLAELDPSRFYWPSSPYGGDDHNDAAAGDRHNWQTWHGFIYPRRFGQSPERSLTPEGVSYRHYAEDLARFSSEFGLHAAPVLETLRRNVPAVALHLGSASVSYRNTDYPQAQGSLILQAHTGLPNDLQQYIDYAMIAQAEGLKFGLEHYRRRKPHCSGTLIWQLNDCWPAISCSLLDYYRFPKASYFYVKRAFAPVILTFKQIKDGIELWLVNDTLAEYRDTISWGRGKLSGETLSREPLQVSAPPNSACIVKRIRSDKAGFSPFTDYLYAFSDSGGFPANRLFLAEIKDLCLPTARFQAEKRVVSEHEIEVELCSEQFTYFVKIECAIDGTRYADNYFDLYPNRRAVVRIRNAAGRVITPNDIHICSLEN